MQNLCLTLGTAAENVALDEALLDRAESARGPREMLRIWEPAAPLVVLGRSSRLADEVEEAECQRRGIPILRRSSGGAAIVAGPGCLMYAVVLSYERRPQLRSVTEAHRFVLGRLATGLARIVPGVEAQGTSDLVLGDRKFSGNSLRCKQRHLVYHGSLLYDFPLELIGACLKMPPRQPDYRGGRNHRQFLINLPLDAATLREAVLAAWDANEPTDQWPQELVQKLVAERYGRDEWTCER